MPILIVAQIGLGRAVQSVEASVAKVRQDISTSVILDTIASDSAVDEPPTTTHHTPQTRLAGLSEGFGSSQPSDTRLRPPDVAEVCRH